MQNAFNRWREIPAEAKAAIVSLAIGWLLHYAVYFYNFAAKETDRTLYLQLAVGLGICYGVASGRPWARMLCIFFNIGIIALYALYSLVLFQSGEAGWFALTALIAGTFAASTWLLLRRDTKAFFSPPAPSAENPRMRQRQTRRRAEREAGTAHAHRADGDEAQQQGKGIR